MKIGIDVGGSHIGLGIIDSNGNLLLKTEKDYDTHENDMSNIVLDTIKELLNQILKEQQVEKIETIGIAFPGTVSNGIVVKAENLGIEFHTIPIEKLVESAEDALSDIFKGTTRDVAEENIQSRSRGLLLMAISNKRGALVLTTGNKSECAVGYCTLYGDTNGGFAPICDLYKTEVYNLSNHINKAAGREIIPQNTIIKPPSAELRPDQTDQDSLPPYDILDAILKMHIEENLSASEIIEKGFEKSVVEDVLKKVAGAEYKRTQYPIGPKISAVSYTADKNIPVAIKRGLQ